MFVDLSPKCTNFILTLYFSITVVIIYPFIKMQVLKHKKGIIVRGKEDCLKFSISASHNKRQADMKQLRQNISTYFSRTRAHWRPRRPPPPLCRGEGGHGHGTHGKAAGGQQHCPAPPAMAAPPLPWPPRPPWPPHSRHKRGPRPAHWSAVTPLAARATFWGQEAVPRAGFCHPPPCLSAGGAQARAIRCGVLLPLAPERNIFACQQQFKVHN